jgi:hypothetical protein
LLRNLLSSPQVRDCRFVLDSLDDRFAAEWAWTEVKGSVGKALRAEEKQVRTRMIVGGEAAGDVVDDMIAMTCLFDVESGRHHVYRGVLDQTGQSKRNIFAGIVTEQLRTGRITPEEVAMANKNMNRAVAEAG